MRSISPATFETEAVWFVPSSSVLGGLEQMPKLLSSLHAAEHALIALPLFAMCDRWDIGGLSTNVHFQTGRRPCSCTTVTRAASASRSGAMRCSATGWRTRRSSSPGVRVSGCPSCVQSPKCGNLNEMLDKAGALQLLRRISTGCAGASRASSQFQPNRKIRARG